MIPVIVSNIAAAVVLTVIALVLAYEAKRAGR